MARFANPIKAWEQAVAKVMATKKPRTGEKKIYTEADHPHMEAGFRLDLRSDPTMLETRYAANETRVAPDWELLLFNPCVTWIWDGSDKTTSVYMVAAEAKPSLQSSIFRGDAFYITLPTKLIRAWPNTTEFVTLLTLQRHFVTQLLRNTDFDDPLFSALLDRAVNFRYSERMVEATGKPNLNVIRYTEMRNQTMEALGYFKRRKR